MNRVLRALLGAGRGEGLVFGGMQLPPAAAEWSFYVMGMPGSGKSIVLMLLMQQVLPRIGEPGRDDRAVVYDAKRDLVSKLASIGVLDPYDARRLREMGLYNERLDRETLVILNPEDRRCWSWDMAGDFARIDDSHGLASLLVPSRVEASEVRGDDGKDYFREMPFQIVEAVVNTFIKRYPRRWTLRDVILACQDPGDCRSIVAGNPERAFVARVHLDEELMSNETGQSIWTSVIKYTNRFSSLAAVWHRVAAESPSRRFTMGGWTSEQKILLLGQSHKNPDLIQAANKLMFWAISRELHSDVRQRHKVGFGDRTTWVFIDELPLAGYLRGLPEVMRLGRSYGVRVAMAFQDVVDVTTAWGEAFTKSLLAATSTYACLRTESATSRDLMVRAMGTRKFPGDEKNPTRHEQLIHESDFRSLLFPVQVHGLDGFYSTTFKLRPERVHIPWAALAPKLPRDVPEVPDIDPWGDSGIPELRPWAERERMAFGLPAARPVGQDLAPEEAKAGRDPIPAPRPEPEAVDWDAMLGEITASLKRQEGAGGRVRPRGTK